MEFALSLEELPRYMHSAYRRFKPEEKHVTRVCQEDVLLLVYGGVLRFWENGTPVEVKPGEYYIQQQGLFQEGREASEEPEYYYIHFQGTAAETGQRLPRRGNMDLAALLPMIGKLEVLQASGAPKVEINAWFYQILAALHSDMEHAGSQPLLHDLIAKITGRLDAPFSLGAAAKELGYCKNSVITIFRRETGLTPGAFVRKLKLEQAQRLLLESSLPVTQIALECGFGSYTNFYRSFQKRFSCSPGQWRERGGVCPEPEEDTI